MKTYGRFTSEDVLKVVRGGVVVKSLDADDSAVAFCAAVRIGVDPARYVDGLRDIESFKRGKNVLQIGRFQDSPAAADMRGLTLGHEEIKELRRCRLGDCGVKLDAIGIQRLSGVARSAAAADGAVSATLREQLAAYALAYRQRGNVGLIQYDSAKSPIRLSAELQHIVKRSPYLRDLPQPAVGIGGDGASLPPSADDFLYWSKEKLGPKAVITLTHVLIGDPQNGLTAIASKQIYASHYFNASLGLTLLADTSAPGGPPQTLLIYVSRSRLDVFDGLFGGLKRSIVRSRVRNAAAEMLRHLRDRLEASHP